MIDINLNEVLVMAKKLGNVVVEKTRKTINICLVDLKVFYARGKVWYNRNFHNFFNFKMTKGMFGILFLKI